MSNIIKIWIFAIILLIASCSVFAQHTIFQLNGKQTSALKYQVNNDDNTLYYQFQKKNGKTKTKSFSLSEVYSVKLESGKENIFYAPSSDEFSVEEMRQVLNGEFTALNDYSPKWAFATGFVVGAGSMIYPANPFYTLSVPIALNIGFAFISPSDKYISKHYPDFNEDELFIYGFKQSGKTKILKNTFIGTLSGVTAGIIARFLIAEYAN